MNGLERYRANSDLWRELAFSQQIDPEWGACDHNQDSRYKILLELQYDFRESDEELIRFLFEQEIISRERDDFQGIGDDLKLGAYLLCRFKRPEDIVLFHRAKFANFDTGCGFDREFMFVALRRGTEDYAKREFPAIYEDIVGDWDGNEMGNYFEEWLVDLSDEFPDSVEREHDLTLFERYIRFDDLTRARNHLERWANAEAESSDKANALQHYYKRLKDYPLAIKYARKQFESVDTNWDRASMLRCLLEYHRLAEDFDGGLKVVQELNDTFDKFDDWKQTGLGRMSVHEAFELSLACDNRAKARQVFEYADRWYRQMNAVSLVALEAAWKAAEKWNLTDRADYFQKKVYQERAALTQGRNKWP